MFLSMLILAYTKKIWFDNYKTRALMAELKGNRPHFLSVSLCTWTISLLVHLKAVNCPAGPVLPASLQVAQW